MADYTSRIDDKGNKYGVVELDLVEQGWMMMAVWDRAKAGDVVARSLYRKLRAAAVACGVEWRYGQPWEEEPHPHG